MIDYPVPNILGAKDSEVIGMVCRVFAVVEDENPTEIVRRYPDRFTGIGCIPKEHEIRTNPQVKPVVQGQRKVQLPIKHLVKNKLDEREHLDLWEPVTEPTEWVRNAMYVSKPGGDIRICMDPKDLNKAIMIEHYPLKTIEDVAAELDSATVFTVLDMNQGFHQISLKESCRNLTCFNTPFGRYRYKRLPMGICSASEVFQRNMEDIFGHFEGAKIIIDDMVIHDTPRNPGIKGHNKALIKVLEIARKNNITFKIKKLKVGKNEVHFTGHTLTTEGMKISKDKVKAVQ